MSRTPPLRASIALGSLLLTLSACVPSPPPRPPRTQLEVRQIQSREYATTDNRMVMKALLNVLQDDGFIVKNAVVELGLITATKELEVKDNSFGSFSLGLGGSTGSGWALGPGWNNSDNEIRRTNTVVEVSANVSEFGKSTRVRVNFQQKTLNNVGGVENVKQIDEPEFYRDFFAKVDKGIYLQRERL